MRTITVALVLALLPGAIDSQSIAAAQRAAVTAPRASSTTGIAVGNTARKTGSGEWEWVIYVMGDDAALGRISCVTYLLHATFANRSPRICTRGATPGKGFPLKASGWGTFTVGVTIDFQDKSQRLFTHNLTFQAEAEGWAALSGRSVRIPVTANRLEDGHFVFTVNLAPGGGPNLDSVDVLVTEDGSTGSTAWTFELLLDDQPWFRIPRQSFSDRAKPLRIRAGAMTKARDGSRGDASSVRIVGYR